MVTQRQAIMLILSIVVIVAIPGMVIKMNTSSTGQFYYAGGTIQYENDKEACAAIDCPDGPAVPIETKGDIMPYGSRRMLAYCRCPQSGIELPPVPLVRTLPLERYGPSPLVETPGYPWTASSYYYVPVPYYYNTPVQYHSYYYVPIQYETTR